MWRPYITIPYAMIDSGSDSSIVSENIAKHLGLKIDRKKVHRLNGVASKSHSLGTINIVPVTIEDGENRDTIPNEFSVVPTEYDDNKWKRIIPIYSWDTVAVSCRMGTLSEEGI